QEVTFDIPSPPPATVTVRSDVSGAKVRINGYMRGQTPLDRAVTRPGPLDITVTTADGRARSIQGTLAISEQKTFEVRFDEKDGSAAPDISELGRLTLAFTPTGPVLNAKGDLIGESPLDAVPMRAGDHQLILRSADGRYQRAINISIEPNKTA